MSKICPRRFSDEQIYQILAEPYNNSEMARRIGTTRQMVQQIRVGQSYSDFFPEIERASKRGNKSCSKCKHRKARVTETHPNPCSFDFPEPLEFGVFYANQCNLFIQEGNG
jgi:hypothetical protein